MGAAGKSGGGVEVTEYRMSIHYRICHGPVDELLGIYVGEKEAWADSVGLDPTSIAIDRRDLFGGNKKEGGVAGIAEWLPGGPTQVMPEHLAARMGLTSATCPAYRTMASVFFIGNGSLTTDIMGQLAGGLFGEQQNFIYGGQGFLWSANNPYLKSIWFKVRRRPRGLNPAISMIGADANPAHIIYECKTNTDWGEGAPPTSFNLDSFNTAAQTLYNEGFGLSLMWTKQTSVDAFVSEVLDHIQATLFVNPRNGLWELKLIRGDYDIDDLPILDVNNCKVIGFQRQGIGETINEIVVTWTNPENEQEETVGAQNNANIAMQGDIVSDSRNYYGVRNAELAQSLAFRDLAAVSAPLATYDIEADRSAWAFVPGGVARLQYPFKTPDGDVDMIDTVIRLGPIDYGKPGTPRVSFSASDDIFAAASADFDAADGSQWDDPSADPAPPALARVITAPAYAVLRATGMPAYPSVYPAALISGAGTDTFSYDIYGEAVLTNGSAVADLIGTRPTMGRSTLLAALGAEATTALPLLFGTPVQGGPGPRPSGFMIIGNVAEPGQEIALVDSFDEEDGWVLKRGVLDTVPRAWPAGTTVLFVTGDANLIITSALYTEGETARFRVSPMTSRGVLAFDESPIIAATIGARPHLPNRPANVTVAGVAFGVADVSGSLPATIPVTWANRNRLLEDNVVLAWGDATMLPETGQTTTIRVLSTAGAVLDTHAGLTGTSFDLPTTSFTGQQAVDIAVYATRDGLDSLQSHRVRVKLTSFGWGNDWDNDWGGTGGAPAPEPTPDDPDPGTTFPDVPPWALG